MLGPVWAALFQSKILAAYLYVKFVEIYLLGSDKKLIFVDGGLFSCRV